MASLLSTRPSRIFLFLFIALFILSLVVHLPRTVRGEEEDGELDVSDDSGALTDVTDDADVDEEIDDEEIIEEEVEEEEEEEEEYKPGQKLNPHPDISTFYLLPNVKEHQLLQGENILLLVGVHNSAVNSGFNISYIGAHLHSVFDYDYYVQNFTVKQQEALVMPGAETTIEYYFRPDPTLESVEFQLSAWIVYNSSQGRLYQTEVLNTTVILVEQYQPWTILSALSWLTTVAVISAASYFVYYIVGGSTTKKSRTVKRKTVPSKDKDGTPAENGWEVKTYTPSDKAKVAGARKTRSSSKKGSKKKSEEQVSQGAREAAAE